MEEETAAAAMVGVEDERRAAGGNGRQRWKEITWGEPESESEAGRVVEVDRTARRFFADFERAESSHRATCHSRSGLGPWR